MTFYSITPGRVVINAGWIVARGPRVAAVEFDLRTKRAVIVAYHSRGNDGVPGLVLGDDEGTLHVNRRYKRGTFIDFPEYAGWDIWSADCARYTLRLCLGRYSKRAR